MYVCVCWTVQPCLSTALRKKKKGRHEKFVLRGFIFLRTLRPRTTPLDWVSKKKWKEKERKKRKKERKNARRNHSNRKTETLYASSVSCSRCSFPRSGHQRNDLANHFFRYPYSSRKKRKEKKIRVFDIHSARTVPYRFVTLLTFPREYKRYMAVFIATLPLISTMQSINYINERRGCWVITKW